MRERETGPMRLFWRLCQCVSLSRGVCGRLISYLLSHWVAQPSHARERERERERSICKVPLASTQVQVPKINHNRGIIVSGDPAVGKRCSTGLAPTQVGSSVRTHLFHFLQFRSFQVFSYAILPPSLGSSSLPFSTSIAITLFPTYLSSRLTT